MFHSRVGWGNVARMRGTGIVIAALALVLAGAAPPAPRPLDLSGDGVPPGMVAFFTTPACPSAWKPADLAAGRLVIAVTDPIAVGRTVGTPLAAAEDRVHGHAIAAAIGLPAKSISAADGNNQSGGASGSRTLAGAAGPAPSGLPFVQLAACVRSLP